MMKKNLSNKLSAFITSAGIVFLFTVFFHWLFSKTNLTLHGSIAAAASVLLAAVIYIQFVPLWLDLWFGERLTSGQKVQCREENTHQHTAEKMPVYASVKISAHPSAKTDESSKTPPYTYIKIFLSLAAYCFAVLVIIFAVRYINGCSHTFSQSLGVWRETDANHYQDIAMQWYLSDGHWDRLVQLVFLPGYPIAVKLAALITGDYYLAAFAVSIISFSLAGCVFYKLMRLDLSHSDAVRAVKYLCIFPASYFFAGPMSESLFLLLCICCIYCIRTDRWFLGCLAGGYAAFTRSLGITLLVPCIMELVRQAVSADNTASKGIPAKKLVSVLLIPAGFAAYCGINYAVSGNFFKFMEYQSKHWSQNLGWFFNTASYQTELIASNWGTNFKIILGLWLPNILMIFASLAIMAFAVKKLRPCYTAWFIAYFIIAVGATWLLSAPRYLAAMAVLPMALSALAKSKRADAAFTVCCIMLNTAYLCAFALRWYVW